MTPTFLNRPFDIVGGGLAVLVVAVGNQHDGAATGRPAEQARAFQESVEQGRAATGAHRANGLAQGCCVVGRSGDTADVGVEWRDDGAVLVAKTGGQPLGGAPHVVHPSRHALTVVDEQEEIGFDALARDEIDRLFDSRLRTP